jgi:hypothetical protein
MKKNPVEELVLPESEEQLLKSFLDEYDYMSWMTRVAVLQLLIERPELVSETRGRLLSILDNPNLSLSDESIVDRMKMDIHFTAYHSTEALLALIFALVVDPGLPWLYLTKYTSRDFNQMVSQLADKGLSTFSSDEKLVAKALFFNVKPGRLDDLVEHSTQFAIEYIRELAREFRDRQDYNSFKHGLRTLKPKTSLTSLSSADGKTILRWTELATTYLEVGAPFETKGHMVRCIKLVSKAIDYEKSVRIIETNTHLVHNLLEIRRAKTTGKTKITLKLFDKERRAFDILRRTKIGLTLDKMTMTRRPIEPGRPPLDKIRSKKPATPSANPMPSA